MKHKKQRKTRTGAAMAALALLSITSPLPALSSTPLEPTSPQALGPAYPSTLPALPDERGDFDKAESAFQGRDADAPILLKEFLANYPSSVLTSEARLMLADWYFYNGQYSLALQNYNAISDNTFTGDVKEGMLYRKAYSHIKQGYHNEAKKYLRSLRNSKAYGDDALFYLAYIDYVNGKYDEAYDQFKKIMGSGPKGAEAEYYINQIDYLRGQYQKVAATSDRLLSVPIPDELRGETMRVGGLSYFKLGDKTSARNILKRYADLTGSGAELAALYSLATIYYDEGNYEKALPLFTTVTEDRGELSQSAWLYIGQIYLAQGDTQAAAMAFDKAARESWNGDVSETAAYNLAVTSTNGMTLPFGDAAAAMENFIETYPDSPYSSSLSNYLANAYYGRRDYENALRQVDRISNPDASTRAMKQKILYQYGISRLQQDDVEGAIRYLTEASAAGQPDREVAAQASLWLGDAYYMKKDYQAAAKAYETAIASGKLGNNTALAQYNMGYAYMKLHNYKKAEGAFKSATGGKGLSTQQQTDAKLRYADCLYYNGKYNDALAIFRQLKNAGGQDAVFAQIREADILGRNGQVSEKIAILERLNQSGNTGIWSSTIYSRLADAYSERGDDRKAAQMYANMLDNATGNTDTSQVYFSLATNAENLYNSGDREAAREVYKRLETSGIDALYPSAIQGIMRTSADNAEIAAYAAKAAALPGLSAEETDEALYYGAKAGLALGGKARTEALGTLQTLAESTDRLWGARAAVTLGETYLAEGKVAEAEKVLLALIDDGSDDNYWLARGYITLADVYIAQKKDYLAKLYLETLQANYPGKERDIIEMINTRLKSLNK